MSRKRKRGRRRGRNKRAKLLHFLSKIYVIGLVRDFITVIMNEKNPNNYFP